jgi:hypothetical protein
MDAGDVEKPGEATSLLPDMFKKPGNFPKASYNPLSGAFWKYHMGTDMLVASWLFVVGSAFWVWLCVDVVVFDHTRYFAYAFDNYLTLTSSVLFLIGSVYFVKLSYPEAMQQMMEDLAQQGGKEQAGTLTFTEKYFTGTDMTIALWFFNFATLPFLVYGLYLIGADPSSYYGYVYTIGVGFAFAAMFFWLYASLPENILANEGQGSTVVFDKWIAGSPSCCCGCFQSFVEKHCKSDMLFGMWIFTVGTCLGVPYAFYLVAVEPTVYSAWLEFGLIISFAIGMVAMTYTSYPENFNSTLCYDVLTCSRGTKKEAPA